MGRLFYNMLIGALALVTNLGIAQAQGQRMQPNFNSGSSGVSLGFPVNRHIVSTVNGHLLSLSADETGDISLEVIGFAPNRQRTRIQTPPAAQFRQADNSFQANGQGMMQSANDGGQVLPSTGDQSSFSNVAGTAITNFAPPGMNQMAGSNDQTPMGPNGLAGSANNFGSVGSMPSNPNFQQQAPGQPDNGPNGFAGSPNAFGDLGSVPSNPNFKQQAGAQPNNEPPFKNGGGFGNQQSSPFPANGGPANFPSNPPQMTPQIVSPQITPQIVSPQITPQIVSPQMTPQIVSPQNTVGGMAPSLAGIAHILRDSDEFQDISVERSYVFGQDGRIQSTVQLSRDSNEYDDASLEVNLNLLPQIRSLLNNQLQTQHQVVSNNPRMVFFHQDDQDNDMSLELQGILTNPWFQQQIQEIDVRLKRAPAARSKRLMEKYAHALALSSPSTNTAPATIHSPFFLSLLITWISVGLIL
ncbi:uncharacterized protein LOC124207469 isoform X2 [Daphnia pulex]|uniref:uncharacterized protein LOC124207469 isoform X2 n=1 Tax=Daphnia pulex TaxID=6669 RepID=UPI001EDCAD93|nr:uncharacterized protein LOC124207469 isoform X2 [Daphnia pulex]